MVPILAACLLLGAQAQPPPEGRSQDQLIEQFRKDWHSQTGTEDERARQALVRMGLPAVAALVRELSNPDPGIAVTAAAALGEIGEPAIPALAATLESGPEDARFQAAATLLWLGSRRSDLGLATRAALAGSKHPAGGIRVKSVEILGMIAEEAHLTPAEANQTLSALVVALADPDEAVQMTAARAVRQFGPAGARAVPALEKLLASKQEFVRHEATGALAEIRVPMADVVRALEQGEPDVRRRLVFILGLMGPAAREALAALEALEATETDASLRAAATDAIRRIEAK